MSGAEVANPRRVLAVTLEGAVDTLARVVKDLTGKAPKSASTSLAGTTHDLNLKTPYYSATVPIWLDLIESPSDWASSFLSEEASEVLAVLGGVVLVFPLPDSSSSPLSADQVRELIHHVGQVVDKGLGGWEWDGVRLAVGVGDGEPDEWDELCAEAGMEFVQLGGSQQGRNEFGEKTGIARVKEALETNDWAQLDDSPLSDFGDFEGATSGKPDDEALDPEKLDFGYDPADFEGLRAAIWTSGQEETPDNVEKLATPNIKAQDQVPEAPSKAVSETKTEFKELLGELDDDDIVKVENMMRKLQAVREAGEGMGEAQRRRLAARAVEEVMKEL